ncbi:hypothetical protein QTN25_008740 [Entamoeba marina]
MFLTVVISFFVLFSYVLPCNANSFPLNHYSSLDGVRSYDDSSLLSDLKQGSEASNSSSYDFVLCHYENSEGEVSESYCDSIDDFSLPSDYPGSINAGGECTLFLDGDYNLPSDFPGSINAQGNCTISDITSLSNITLNSYSVTFNDLISLINVNDVNDDNGEIILKTVCSISSSYIPTLIPQAIVTLLNKSVSIGKIDINSDFQQIIIPSSVETLSVNNLTGSLSSSYSTVFSLEYSETQLSVNYGGSSSSSQYILLECYNRKIVSSHSSCDNQAVIIGSGESCTNLGYYNHECYYVSDNYYQLTDSSKIDYSCPCNSENSNCVISISECSEYTQEYEMTKFIISSSLTLNSLKGNFELVTNSNEIVLTLTEISNNIIFVGNDSNTVTFIQVHLIRIVICFLLVVHNLLTKIL